MYAIDDGTAVIQCTLWTKSQDGSERHVPHVTPSLGDRVRVLGKLRIPRWGGQQLEAILEAETGSLQWELVVDGMELVADANEEVLHWVACARLWKQVYSKPPQSLKRKRKVVPASVIELSRIILDEVRLAKDVDFRQDLTGYERSKLAMASTMFSVREVEELPKVRQFISVTGSGVLASTLKRLMKQGFIYRVDQERYPGKEYALVTHVTTLGPCIVDILQQAKATSKEAHVGVWKSEICREMRKDSRFVYIQESRVERSLKMLLQEGHIF